MTPRTALVAAIAAAATAVLAAFVKRPVRHPEPQGSWRPADHQPAPR